MYSEVYLNRRDMACLGVQPHHLLSDQILFKLLTIKLLLLEVGVCTSVCFFLGEKENIGQLEVMVVILPER